MTSRRASILASLATFTLTLGACTDKNAAQFQGYIEGTYVYVSAENAGRVVERPVVAGDFVEEGDVIARLDDAEERESVAAAQARLAQAEAQYANLLSGQRAEEISVIAAQLSQARASLNLADEEYQRQLILRERGIVSQSVVDDAKTKRDTAQASAEAVERQLIVCKLPARPEEIAASERNVAAEQALLAQAQIHLERRQLMAPAAGRVDDTFYEPGERVNAGQPIVSLLPYVNRKVRFFLPEGQLSSVKIGDRVNVSCDGCADGLTAEIDRHRDRSGVHAAGHLFAGETRKACVPDRGEAVGATEQLKVGQPVDVTLMPSAEAGS